MSSFLRTSLVVGFQMAEDRDLFSLWPFGDTILFDYYVYTPDKRPPAAGGYMFSRGEAGFDYGDYMMGAPWDDWDAEVTGQSNYLYHIAGTAKDSAGAAVSGATMDLYRTVDDVLLQTTQSQASGLFSFGVNDNTTQCYIRAWKLAPAIQGTSVDTLVGS